MLITSLLLISFLACAAYIIMQLKNKNSNEGFSDEDFSDFNPKNLRTESNQETSLKLQTLMSSHRITSTEARDESFIKRQIVEEDALTRLSKIEARITSGLKILDELTQATSDFNLILASGKAGKLQLFGNKFLKVVQGRAAKASELKNASAMSDAEISKFIVRSFTVEMNVMNDLVDRENYITAVSWDDLSSMIETFERDINEVVKLMKSNKQGMTSSL